MQFNRWWEKLTLIVLNLRQELIDSFLKVQVQNLGERGSSTTILGRVKADTYQRKTVKKDIVHFTNFYDNDAHG